MSIFIEEKDCIEVAVHYILEPNGGITIFENPIVKAPSVKKNPISETKENPISEAKGDLIVEDNGKPIVETKGDPIVETQTINMVFNRPDFSTSQRLMSSSTVTDSNGNQTMNIMMLQNNLIYFLAKSWDVKDDAGEPVELSNYNIGKLRVEIARALVTQLVEKVGQIL